MPLKSSMLARTATYGSGSYPEAVAYDVRLMQATLNPYNGPGLLPTPE